MKYTCPMHPEVIQDGPGPCPKCGMALEPKDVSASPENKEYKDMSRRFWASLALSAPIVLLEKILPMRLVSWMELFFTTPVVL